MRSDEEIEKAFEKWKNNYSADFLPSMLTSAKGGFEGGIEYADHNPNPEIYNFFLQHLITEKKKLQNRVKKLTEALEHIASKNAFDVTFMTIARKAIEEE